MQLLKFLYLIPVLVLLSGTCIAYAQLNNTKAQQIEPDAKVFIDRNYYGPSAIVYASILDRDFNRDDAVVESIDLTQIVNGDPIVEVKIVQPTKGTLTLSAVDGSMKDRSGKAVTKAIESGPNTSLFEFEAKLPDDIEPNSSVTVLFHDPFALTTSKPETPVRQRIDLTDTHFADGTGNSLKNASVGMEVIISSMIHSNISSKQEYAYIVQVKDSDDFTVSLSSIIGSLEPQRSASASVSWTPNQAGTYTIEIFVWDKLLKPMPLLLKEEKRTIVVT